MRSQKPIVEITDLKIADHFDLGEKPFFSFLPGVKKTIFEGVKKKIVTMQGCAGGHARNTFYAERSRDHP